MNGEQRPIPGNCSVALDGQGLDIWRNSAGSPKIRARWSMSTIAFPHDIGAQARITVLGARAHEWLIDLLVCFDKKNETVLEVWRASPQRIVTSYPVLTIPSTEQIRKYLESAEATRHGFRMRTKTKKILVRASGDESPYVGYAFDFNVFDVFISFKSNETGHIAAELATALEYCDLTVWLAPAVIRTGNYDRKIREGIEHSHSFVIIWSKSSKTPHEATGGAKAWSQASEIDLIRDKDRVYHYAAEGVLVPAQDIRDTYHVTRLPGVSVEALAELVLQGLRS